MAKEWESRDLVHRWTSRPHGEGFDFKCKDGESVRLTRSPGKGGGSEGVGDLPVSSVFGSVISGQGHWRLILSC